jgi:hypothetical protein
LLQGAQAGDDRVEEIPQQQGGVLIEEQFAVAGLIAGGPGGVEPFQQRQQHSKVLAALKVGSPDLLASAGQGSRALEGC